MRDIDRLHLARRPEDGQWRRRAFRSGDGSASQSSVVSMVSQGVQSNDIGNLPANELLICTRLFGRSETAREKWMQNPSLRKILNHFLRTTTSSIYVDDTSGKPNFAVDPILSNSNTIVRLPGAPVAGFHRDSDPWQQFNYDRQKTGFMHGADIAATVLVPGIDMSAENGGTLVSMADEVFLRCV